MENQINLVIDTETGRFGSKNNAYSSDGELVSIHSFDGKNSKGYQAKDFTSFTLKGVKTLILFNGKFDLAFLRKFSLLPEQLPTIWDVQLAHFLLSRQQSRMPSLNQVLEHYGLPQKLDVVKTEYWDRGIETRDVPWDILKEYGNYDCYGTYQAFLRQQEQFKQKPQLYKLFQLQCKDLLVLHEMEWNGLKYNSEQCKETSEKLQIEIKAIEQQLGSRYPSIPLNFNSNSQLSAYLYGGSIKQEVRTIAGFYKTGPKTGMPRYKIEEVEHTLPMLVEPLKGSEMQKEGVYSTDEATLKKLKGAKETVDLLLKLAKLSKLKETYYDGMNKLNNKMNWPKDMLHGNYNQCVALTGRLSSSKPNQQNLSGDFLKMMETRYRSSGVMNDE